MTALALPASTVTTGLPQLTPAQASERGARSLVIGVAPPGGALTAEWVPALVEALEAGLDLVSGMHTRLESVSQLSVAAERLGRRLINVREPPTRLPVGSGAKRSGKRLLTVGTDCALGLPVADPLRSGSELDRLVDACLKGLH